MGWCPPFTGADALGTQRLMLSALHIKTRLLMSIRDAHDHTASQQERRQENVQYEG